MGNLDDSQVADDDQGLSYEEKLKYVSVIAKPMASKKTLGRIRKLMRKVQQVKSVGRQSSFVYGLKNVQKNLRKGAKGMVLIAGDISPVDLIIHIPGICEEKGLPYIYVPSRQDLLARPGSTTGTVVVLLSENKEYEEAYNKVLEDVKKSAHIIDAM